MAANRGGRPILSKEMHVDETNRGGTMSIQFRPVDTVMQDHHVPIVFLHLRCQGTCQMPSQVHNVLNGLERSHSSTVVLVEKIKYLILDQLRDVPEKIMHVKNHVTAQEAIEGVGDLMTGQNTAPRKPLSQCRRCRW